jgi:hypothetical protein
MHRYHTAHWSRLLLFCVSLNIDHEKMLPVKVKIFILYCIYHVICQFCKVVTYFFHRHFIKSVLIFALSVLVLYRYAKKHFYQKLLYTVQPSFIGIHSTTRTKRLCAFVYIHFAHRTHKRTKSMKSVTQLTVPKMLSIDTAKMINHAEHLIALYM